MVPRVSKEGGKGVLVRLPKKELKAFDRLSQLLQIERLRFFQSSVSEVLFATETLRPRFPQNGLFDKIRTSGETRQQAFELGSGGVQSLPNGKTILGWIPLSPDERRLVDRDAGRMDCSPARFAMQALYTMLKLSGQSSEMREIPEFIIRKSAHLLAQQPIIGEDGSGVAGETHADRWLREMNELLRLTSNKGRSELSTGNNSQLPLTSDISLG